MSNIKSSLIPDGEQILGSWAVYIGGQGPSSRKITGRLHVTECAVTFEAGLLLHENAPASIGNRNRPLSDPIHILLSR